MLVKTLRVLALAWPCLAAASAHADELPPENGCTPALVYSVDAANLEFRSDRIVVHAEGTASTAGWKAPALKLVSRSSDGASATFEFVACEPAIAAEVMSPVSATGDIADQVKALKLVVIKAKSNSQTLTVAGF